MAAPQVSGAAALLKSKASGDSHQIRSTLRRTAIVPNNYDKAYYDTGYLDTLGALTHKDR